MPARFQHFQFTYTYDVAGGVRDHIMTQPENGFLIMEEFFEPTPDFFLRASVPQKHTLLHEIIDAYLNLWLEYLVWKVDYQDSSEVLEHMLTGYGLSFTPFGSVSDEHEENERKLDALFEQAKRDCLPRVVEEVFTLLFADRSMLFELNGIAASCVKKMSRSEHPQWLSKDGMVKRCTYWPKWVKDAIYYRDKGRCALCLADISALLVAGQDKQLDHMVPLAAGGTNDPCNLQYLCPTCNLRKGKKAATSSHTALYW